MLPILVLQQKSTGVEIFRQKTDFSIIQWEKKTVKQLLKTPDKKDFWNALRAGDYIASWYGPNHDKFMRTMDRETYHTVCNFVFKEPRADNLTQDEMIELLHHISKMYEKTPLKFSKNVEKRKYNLDKASKVL